MRRPPLTQAFGPRRRAGAAALLAAGCLGATGAAGPAAGGTSGTSAAAGVALSWGAGELDGQGGAGPALDQPGLVALPAGAAVVMLRASPGPASFALALTSAGEVYGWGANDCGQLGVSATDRIATPAKIPGLPSDVVAIDAADDFGLAVTASGEVWAWGRNDLGQLGADPATTTTLCITGGRTFRYQPAKVPLPAGVHAVGRAGSVSGGTGHALVLTSSRAGGPPSGVYDWGYDGSGELGRTGAAGALVEQPGPMDLPAGVSPAQVSAGSQFTLLLTSSGAALSAGYGFGGQLGNGQFPSGPTPALQPVLLGGSGTAVQLEAGQETGLALLSDSTVESWGVSGSGQRGDGSAELKTGAPGAVAMPAGAKVTAIAISNDAALAATASGALYGWGDQQALNQPGSPAGGVATPVLVPLPAGVRASAVALAGRVGYALAEPASVPPQTAVTAAVQRVSGTVLVKAPGGASFRSLTSSGLIPIGSTVDVRGGTVRLTTTRGSAGGLQSARFHDGVFTLRQPAERRASTELRLVSDFAGCPASGGSAGAARRKRKPKSSVNRLWGDGKGHYTVTGHDGATAVKGTRWLTQDRCDGTFVEVRSGTVSVRDFGLHRTVSVRAGGSYLAGRAR